jgi:hypothetical protein
MGYTARGGARRAAGEGSGVELHAPNPSAEET